MSKKLSTAERIQQSHKIHNSKYDYSLWPSDVKLATLVDIICPEHGKFEQTIKNHITAGHGCRLCHNDRLGKQRKLPTAHFITKSNEMHNNKYDYSMWDSNISSADIVDIVCLVHGTFAQRVNKHMSGDGCPVCKQDTLSKAMKKDVSHFLNQMKITHGSLYDYSLLPPVVYSDQKVDIICNAHGQFSQQANAHILGQGCPACKKIRTKTTNLNKYGTTHWVNKHIPPDVVTKLESIDWLVEQHHTNKLSQLEIAEGLGVSATTVARSMKTFDIEIRNYFTSIGQKEIEQFLVDAGVDIVTNTRSIIPPYELDIYLPEYNLAIEYNGLYWHSDAAGKDSTYHLNKTQQCENNNIRLIHIFEDEWKNMKQQCKDTILHFVGKSKKGDYARKCTTKEISWKQAKEFLTKYHLLGAGTCGNYRIGSFNTNDELIGVMVFGQQNNERSTPGVIELKRFVTNKKNNPGLGSKMFKYALDDKQYEQVIAFVDRRWFTGLVKDYIGFTLLYTTQPTIWWTDGKSRFHRRYITKQQLVDRGYDANKSKKTILAEQHIYRIWDCGKIKLCYNRTKDVAIGQ